MALEQGTAGTMGGGWGDRPVRPAPFLVDQRSLDGYVNATALCTAAGKSWTRYHRAVSTERFLGALGAALGAQTQLVIADPVGDQRRLPVIWVHPRVAVHLGQWLSPEFAVLVTDTVLRPRVAAQARVHKLPASTSSVDLAGYYRSKPIDRDARGLHRRLVVMLLIAVASTFLIYLK